jgi:hypothetical protein
LEALELVLQEMQQQQASPAPGKSGSMILDMMNEAEYTTQPVDIETFVKDEYFLGNTCSGLYPRLMADLRELFGGGYQEAIYTGSIGWGKTFAASIGVCRILYELSCMKDPQRSFGLAPGSNISIVCLSVNEGLAMKVAFENVATKIKASPYFQQHFPFKETRKEFRFPNNVWLAARATTDTSALGLNVIGSLLDETNFFSSGKKPDPRMGALDHAEVLYTGLKRRMRSRFERRGRLPGMMFLVSSKKTREDFTARRIRASANDPTVFARDYSLWDVKPEEYYSSEKFYVVCGNENTPSKLLTDEEVPRFRAAQEAGTLPDGVTVIAVPEDFRQDFDSDLEGAIRDIAGISTVAIRPFIQRREKLVATPGLFHPFSTEVWDPSKSGTFLWDRMVQKTQEKDFGGYTHELLRPIVNPQIPRHVHIDPSYRKDSTGVCVAHVCGWKDVLRRTDDGEVYQERAPIFHVDLILRVIPPVGDEIVLGDVRRLVYELSQHGYMITYVTLDTWQSVDSLQQFKQKGYRAEHLSVDTKQDPYEHLKTAFYEDRVKVYAYASLFKELHQLERDETKKKIDHPPKGSKDVSDALAGCLYTLSQRTATQPLPIIKGLSYAPDVWMEEHLHASAAQQHGAAPDGLFFPHQPGSARMPEGAALPFLGGGRGYGLGVGADSDWGDNGGGWKPL